MVTETDSEMLNELFEKHLRSQQDSVIIFGVNYDPAKILKEFDPVYYDVLKSEWTREFFDKLDEEVL